MALEIPLVGTYCNINCIHSNRDFLSHISDAPIQNSHAAEITKLEENKSIAVRGQDFDKATKIQTKIDDLVKKDEEKIYAGTD